MAESNQPIGHIAIEDDQTGKGEDEDAELRRIGAVWPQDSDKVLYNGTLNLLGRKRRIVVFPNPDHPDTEIEPEGQ